MGAGCDREPDRDRHRDVHPAGESTSINARGQACSGDSAAWVGLVAAFFREPYLTKTGATWRLALTFAAAAGLAAAIVTEALVGRH
jgi:hypothetical protein